MTLSFFAVAAGALVLTHLLDRPIRTQWQVGLSAFLLGFVATIVLIRGLAESRDIGRTTDFDRVVNAAIAEATQDPSPLIVFSGASYSRNAIDPQRLSLALTEAGYPYRVINLSLEAASIFEREAHLQQFMQMSGRVPDLVFVEVSEAFDTKAAYMFANSKFNARAIEQFDIPTSWQTLRGVLDGACYGVVDCVKDAGFVGLHLALNSVNIGLIGRGEDPQKAPAMPAWDPQYAARATVDSQPVTQQVTTNQAVPNWVASYRRMLRQKLERAGVRRVAYYQPPVISPTERAYLVNACATELADKICIAADDPELLTALDADIWLDAWHLLEPGAAIYNRWLADKLLASGVLEPSP